MTLFVAPVSANAPTIGVSYVVGFSNIAEAVTTAIQWGIFFALVAAGLFLIWAGFQYVTAGDDPDQAEAARTRMANAVIGVVIVASVYLILRLVSAIIPGADEIFRF